MKDIEDKKTKNKNINKPKEKIKQKKIQIVAFSTDDTDYIPIYINNIFLGQQNHTILKKSKLACTFYTKTNDSLDETKIMICSVFNLSREYTGITDVNCYLLIIDLTKKDSIEKLNSIINYAKDNCRFSKKFFVLGMITRDEEDKIEINKEDITKILDVNKMNYEYKQIILSNPKEITDFFLEIIDYSSYHGIDDEISEEKVESIKENSDSDKDSNNSLMAYKNLFDIILSFNTIQSLKKVGI